MHTNWLGDPQYELEDIINPYNLYESVELCKRGTIWKDSVLEFDIYKEFGIHEIMDSFYNPCRTPYVDDMFHTIINERGTERMICSLTIRDRIIQKCFNTHFLLPCFVPRLIYDNVASIKGRGMDIALKHMKVHLQKCYRKWGKNFYILKTDIKKYFDHIPHAYCYNLISRFTSDPRILGYFCTMFRKYKYDPYINTPYSGGFCDYGVGLGGEIPQTFGIITLNEMDHICKEQFLLKHYIRYMDDTIMCHNSKEYLIDVLEYLSNYLSYLGLEFNRDKTIITTADQGVKFLKFHYYIEDQGRVYMIANKERIKYQIRKMNHMYRLFKINLLPESQAYISYASYRGHLMRGDTYITCNIMDQIFDTLFNHSEIEWEAYVDPEKYYKEHNIRPHTNSVVISTDDKTRRKRPKKNN